MLCVLCICCVQHWSQLVLDGEANDTILLDGEAKYSDNNFPHKTQFWNSIVNKNLKVYLLSTGHMISCI